MAPQVHNLACPDCRDKNGDDTVRLMTEPGKFKYFCRNGHEFDETETLMNRKPTMLAFNTPKPKPMLNAQEMKITMPGETLEFLKGKFGDRLNAVSIAVMKEMAQPDSFIVDTMNVHRLMGHLGEKPTSGEALVGMVFSLKTDRDNFRKERDDLKAGGKTVEGESGGKGIKLEFDVDETVALYEIAKTKGLSIKAYLEQYVAVALKHGWFTA